MIKILQHKPEKPERLTFDELRHGDTVVIDGSFHQPYLVITQSNQIGSGIDKFLVALFPGSLHISPGHTVRGDPVWVKINLTIDVLSIEEQK